jgi:hypothetical protein
MRFFGFQHSNLPRHCPRKRAIQYTQALALNGKRSRAAYLPITDSRDYWMPAFAGMTQQEEGQ